jgi:hypothetical protein
MLGRKTFRVTWSAWRKVDLSARLFGLARLERLRLYATLLGDWQTITILDAVLNDMMEVKHRLTKLMGRYVHLDTDWEPESNPVPGDTCVDSESPAEPAVRH